ncbi:unnamed protein product [Caenorhabditis sp. 36 PRJEB53466]|nr:unnamed protein product [Caenorhabditis sp. 36 PRJEB53466]
MSRTPSRNSTPPLDLCATLDRNALMVVLEKKDRDLELAAKIGQSLLEQNKDLQTKNEFLEESVNKNLDTIVQLKHELNQRIELLRVYSHLDDDGVPRSNSDETLRERLKSTKSENERLRLECESLRHESAIVTAQKKSSYQLERQLDEANDKVIALRRLVEHKTTELSAQYEQTRRLVRELADKEKKERTMSAEKDEMGAMLIEMIQRHDAQQSELKQMQDEYAELMANFAETESELTKLRSGGNLRMSFDSLYDSLASEIENSETFSPAQRSTALSVLTGRESYANDSGIDAGAAAAGPMSLAAEIEQSERIPLPIFANLSKHSTLCDASTSCTDIFRESSLHQEDVSPSISEEAAYQSFTSAEAANTTTPAVSRHKYTRCSASRSNLSKLQRLHHGNRPHAPRSVEFAAASSSAIQEEEEEEGDRVGYAEPKLGQPGMPGTRDLDVSLRIIKARQEVQKEFAAFCQRKGIDQQQFFGTSQNRRQSHDTSWADFSVSYGVRMIQSMKPNRADESLTLGLRQGVLTRAELLHSPSTSPQHKSLSAMSVSPGSAPLHGVLQRR